MKVFEESAVYPAESMVCDSLQENCSNHTVSDWDRLAINPFGYEEKPVEHVSSSLQASFSNHTVSD